MEKNLQDIWNIVLGEIETEVSKPNYFTLFKKTALLSLEKEVATIAVPSSILINLLQQRYYQIIKKILDKHTGKEISIIFVPKTIIKQGEEKNGPLFLDKRDKEGSVKYEEKKAVPRLLNRVRPEFTFQSMAVSSSNQLAFVSAQTVAKNIGHSYNPLFIYGPVGVGKTHLMQAIANEVYRKNPDNKIIYITSEEFTNEVVEAIRSNDTARMKRRFRTVSLLLIDDIQFLAGKDKVQEELFHTFNILVDNGSQIVLSSDRPPIEIKKLEKRLSSRFASGLTVDIEPPDFELKTAILLIKAKKYSVDLSIDVAKEIAEKSYNTDIRSLEGLLIRIITEAKNKEKGITTEDVLNVLEDGNRKERKHFSSDDVIKGISLYYGLKTTLIKGPKRDALLVKARQIAMYLLKKELGLTFSEIGNVLGGRDHTTVMHGVDKIEKLMPITTSISSDILGITKILSEQKGDYL